MKKALLIGISLLPAILPLGSARAQERKAILRIDGVEAPQIRIFTNASTLKRTAYLFSDRRGMMPLPVPEVLNEKFYYELKGDQSYRFECVQPGEVLALGSVGQIGGKLEALGFQRVNEVKEFKFLDGSPPEMGAIYRKALAAGESFEPPAGTVIAGFDVVREPRPNKAEVLYNGIELPAEWPPKMADDNEPMPVPYLVHPPGLIPIDVGRQLFVDDFLIQDSSLEREYHYPTKYEGNPILKAETKLEKSGRGQLAGATPKSGGLWWSPEKQLFELWYEAGWLNTVAYATSKDGIHWERPSLSMKPGTNQVLPGNIKPDSWTVVRDYTAKDPKQKFKMFLRGGDGRSLMRAFVSEDGINWSKPVSGGLSGDRSTMFFNPFRNKWVYSLRWLPHGKRGRAYVESDDFLQGMHWLPDEPAAWARADKLDPPDPKLGLPPELYNLDAVSYESLMLGFFQILHGPTNRDCAAEGMPKYTGLNFAYSRDGFHWSRPDRKIAIDSERRDVWDRGYVQSLGNICTVRGDKLWFYYIGYAGDKAKKFNQNGIDDINDSGSYANGATGIAFLRRDGFVSLNAGAAGGVVTTRPVVFSGKCLFANIDAPRGSLSAEVLDADGQPIEPFTFANCQPIQGDTTLSQIRWKGDADLAKLAGQPVRFRFKVENGKLYSFWVSRDESGRSDGYVAGGGPGFTSNIDTVGKAELEAEAALQKSAGTSSSPSSDGDNQS